MSYKVMVDGNRHTFLVLEWGKELVTHITMCRGIIEVGRMPTDMCVFLSEIDREPSDLARIYLSTTLEKTSEAVRILKTILGLPVSPESDPKPASTRKSVTTPGKISLAQICEEHQWDSADSRRMLRKAKMKDGDSWEWDQSREEEIVEFLKLKLATIKRQS